MCQICNYNLQYGDKLGFSELTTFCSICRSPEETVYKPWHGIYVADMLWNGVIHHVLQYLSPASFVCPSCGKESFHVFYPCDSEDNSFRLFAENVATSKEVYKEHE
jgi:hypothetical protein